MPDLDEPPASATDKGSRQYGPALDVRLLTGGAIFRDLREFRQVLRHRYVLAHFAGLVIPAILLLYTLDSTQTPIDVQVPAVVVALVAAQVLIVAYVAAVARIAQHLRKGTRIVRIWMTPALVLGAGAMLAVAHVMHQILDVQQDWTEARSQLIPFSCVLYLEIAAAVILRGPIPRALAQMRGGSEPLAALEPASSRQDDRREEYLAVGSTAPEGGGLALRLGLSATDILRLEASGNYVTVVTLTGRHLVPGPFASVVAQMPAGIGRQVQRSHWVALAAIEGVKKQGRDLCLQLACGALVPVSSALKADIQAWLESQGKADPLAYRDATVRSAPGRLS